MKILLVDDERDVVEALTLALSVQWPDCQVSAAYNGEEALERFYAASPNIIILDIAMPGLNGYEVLRHIRQVSDVPIIMLTVRDEEMDKVRALELGADDYITKPFGPMELIARIRAVLRRAEAPAPAPASNFVGGHLTIDFSRLEVTSGDKKAKLTPREASLLAYLVRNAGRPVPHRTLLARAWGDEYVDDVNALKVYISRLRQKVEADPRNPCIIVTEKNLGYKFTRAPGG
jgi:two-component system KDP operon response regulator KdpE